jgi:hypothetical protein
MKGEGKDGMILGSSGTLLLFLSVCRPDVPPQKHDEDSVSRYSTDPARFNL